MSVISHKLSAGGGAGKGGNRYSLFAIGYLPLAVSYYLLAMPGREYWFQAAGLSG
jgi:hypothetical protein